LTVTPDTLKADTLKAASDAQVVEAIAWAGEKARRIEVRGAGSKAAIGRPIEPDLILDISGLNGILDYAPAELVLTARAGTPLAEVEAVLADAGQMLAFEPIDYGPLLGGTPGVGTLGGLIASNASGPRRLKDGAARDHFLGFQAVSGRGEAFKAGGKVVKNVTGFDLAKVMAGSWGTLAILTEVSVKVLPRPAYAGTAVLSGLSAGQACAAMAKACGSPAPITGAAHLPAAVAARLDPIGGGRSATLLRLEGFEATVSVRADALRTLLAEYGGWAWIDGEASAYIWRGVCEVAPLTPLPAPLWRTSVPASHAAETVAGLGEASWLMDWAGGLIWSVGDAPPPLRGAGAHSQLWAGAVEPRVAAHPQMSDAASRVSQSLKAAFDPADILNRGRLLPPLTPRRA